MTKKYTYNYTNEKGRRHALSMAHFADLLERASVKPGKPIAYGIMALIHQWCWENMTDVVGNGPYLEELTDWPGHAGALGDLLTRASLAIKLESLYAFPNALLYIPDTFKRRWTQRSRETWDAAMERTATVGKNTYRSAHYIPRESPTPAGPSPFRQLTDYWCSQWQKKYGQKYPFQSRDGKHCSDLLKQVENDYDKATKIIDGYLKDETPFIRRRGHQLGVLIANLPAYISKCAHGKRERKCTDFSEENPDFDGLRL